MAEDVFAFHLAHAEVLDETEHVQHESFAATDEMAEAFFVLAFAKIKRSSTQTSSVKTGLVRRGLRSNKQSITTVSCGVVCGRE